MNILWDFRLFSYAYRGRGVGNFTKLMAVAIHNVHPDAQLFIWGQKEFIPAEFHEWPVHWLDYKPQTWKNDLFSIPLLIKKHDIDIFHYWIGLGPIFKIGMGLFHKCKTCVTVYDLGIKYWDDIPYCKALRKTWYWKVQKQLFNKADKVVCISEATLDDVKKCFKIKPENISVIYPPMPVKDSGRIVMREKRFIVLDGAPHKNISIVVKAFIAFKKAHPDFLLYILGDIETFECSRYCNNYGLILEKMNHYDELLKSSAGLIFCSTHEGLGLPPIEAMANNCPLILSDIPVFHETCGDAGRFVDPYDMASIVAGMEDVALNIDKWAQLSQDGFKRYCKLSDNAGLKWIDVYNGML